MKEKSKRTSSSSGIHSCEPENVDGFLNWFFEKCIERNYLLWDEFPEIGSCEAYYSYYYAENRLYVIRDGMTGGLYFMKADSPKEAFLKLQQTITEAMHAGEYVYE